MSPLPIDVKTGSDVDEKNMREISNGVVVAVAEDTVEAAHQCTLEVSRGPAA